jgi:hypothetical protein
MSNVNFCTKSYSKAEVIEEVKTILVLPDLHTAIKKYSSLSEDKRENFLKTIYRPAYKKWHSDVRTTTDPKADFYSKCISEALDIFKIIASNPDYFTEGVSENINFGDKEQRTSVSISEMQEKLRNSINTIFQKAKKTIETVTLSRGTLFKDIIREEQNARVYEPTCYAILFYSLIYTLHVSSSGYAPTPGNLAFQYFIVSLMSICFVYLIPFSRYWLFSKIPLGEVICGNGIVGVGSFIFIKIIEVFNKLMQSTSKAGSNDAWVISLLMLPIAFMLIMFRMTVFLFGCVMWIFYQIALGIVKDKRFKDITKEQTFYDGVSEWYIYEMIAKPVSELSLNEKQIIRHFYESYL